MGSAFQIPTDMRFKLFLYILLIGIQNNIAQVPEYSRHLTKSFRVTGTVAVEISNKYGKIQVIPWDKDSVRFDIDLRIRDRHVHGGEPIQRRARGPVL